MHEITIGEVYYFAAIWAVGFASCCSRISRDNTYVGLWHVIGGSSASGFYSFGIVSILRDTSANSDNSSWYWLGVAALVGLLGKEQDAIAKALLSKLVGLTRFIMEHKETNDGQKEN